VHRDESERRQPDRQLGLTDPALAAAATLDPVAVVRAVCPAGGEVLPVFRAPEGRKWWTVGSRRGALRRPLAAVPDKGGAASAGAGADAGGGGVVSSRHGADARRRVRDSPQPADRPRPPGGDFLLLRPAAGAGPTQAARAD